ncbi:MAG: hypothetical protein JWN13_1098 [Betaproteobacteria bacterium]|jgi:hypothetical protein|nr:hypothetical protein [Betaproteobacteria bacterium]
MIKNLVLATGLTYAVIGAIIMFASHHAIYRRATQIVAGYPQMLAALRAQRHDGRFGLTVLLCGNLLQVLAAAGSTAPLSQWRYPAVAGVAVICLYALSRLLIAWRIGRSKRDPVPQSHKTLPIYQTRRSLRLVEAARRDAEKRLAREYADGPTDRNVVYLGRDWECRWWSEKFGVTPGALRNAVVQVGPMAEDIERYLAMRSHKRYPLAA